MFDASKPNTFSAIYELCELAKKSSKPLVFWIGAGASAWANLPLWSDLANILHQEFNRKEPAYDRGQAVDLLKTNNLPGFFGLCKQASSARYFSLLHEHLRIPDALAPVYKRFLEALHAIQPIRVVTTNVDELLEHGLDVQTLLPSNLGIVPELITKKEGFVAKLHGSISDVHSLIFTTEDYDRIVNDEPYSDAVKRIFQDASVVFIGYGLADDYILQAIQKTADLNSVFGNGPHFACLSHDVSNLPPSVNIISYIPDPHRDHRSAIQLIEEVKLHCKTDKQEGIAKTASAPRSLTSAHMISDIYPAGTWQSAQRVVARNTDDNREIIFHCGHGLTTNELPLTISTGMHDLAVGLLCFDRVFAPLAALGRLHALLQGDQFGELVRADVLRFVRLRRQEVVVFSSGKPELVGSLATIQLPEVSGARELTVYELIRKQLSPVPGREREAEDLFHVLENKILDPTPKDQTDLTAMVNSLLLRPSVRTMIGIGGGVPIANIPRWAMFPVLRLAQVVRLGVISRELQLASIKFEFGNDKLAGPAFATAFGEEHAERYASYVVAGNFSTDLGAFINKHPETIQAILRFRDSQDGLHLREALLQSLARSEGSEAYASINAGLSRVIPTTILENARAHFARLCFVAEKENYPAVWHDANYGDTALKLWKQRTAAEFEAICRTQKLNSYDICPCGSGEKIKFCCGETLGVKL